MKREMYVLNLHATIHWPPCSCVRVLYMYVSPQLSRQPVHCAHGCPPSSHKAVVGWIRSVSTGPEGSRHRWPSTQRPPARPASTLRLFTLHPALTLLPPSSCLLGEVSLISMSRYSSDVRGLFCRAWWLQTHTLFVLIAFILVNYDIYKYACRLCYCRT